MYVGMKCQKTQKQVREGVRLTRKYNCIQNPVLHLFSNLRRVTHMLLPLVIKCYLPINNIEHLSKKYNHLLHPVAEI